MISNLKSKLKQMSSITTADSQNNAYAADEKVNSEIGEHKPMDCFELLSHFTLFSTRGCYLLSDFLSIDSSSLGRVAKTDLSSFRFERILFLDTETTGLAGGTGTVAFLVGIGYFQDDSFTVHQFLMRDYIEEIFLLEKLGQLFKNFDIVVTFNGKSFDMPLLESRFIMHRLRHYVKEFIHIDLVHPSRRIWKRRLESCSLQSLEYHILGIRRENDIPGADIPSRYFRYLQTREFSLLDDILLHNRLDILTMIVLSVHLAKAYSNPFQLDNAIDLYSMGRVFESTSDHKHALQCYEKSCALLENTQNLSSLSMLQKKLNRLEEAINIWQKMIQNNQGSILPYIELAKYYEHKKKDPQKALYYTKQARDYILNNGRRNYMSRDLDEINKRQLRLMKKIQKVKDEYRCL